MSEPELRELPVWNDVDFDLSLRATSGNAIVCFEAGWCAVSQTQLRLIRQLAAERSDELSFARVDVDKSPRTAQQFGIISLPTLIRFEQGQSVARLAGQHGREACEAWLAR